MTDRTVLAPGGVRAPLPDRRLRAQAPGAAAPVSAEATAAGLLAVFLVSLLLPVYFDVAGLRLTPFRILLLVAAVPLTLRWLSGAAGRITVGDVFIALHCLWIGVAIFANHGPSRIPFAGMSVVEVFGSYLMGRILIRNVTDYRAFFRYFLIALAILAPFVLVEMQTSRLILNEILGAIAPTHGKAQIGPAQMRLGFFRAQAVVDHPIIWGVLCSLAIANVFYLYRAQLARSMLLTGFAIGMTFTSLSAGPLLAGVLQIGMIGWGWITRNAWWVLVGLMVFAYVAIDLLSNRTPIQVMITYLTFSPHNAYWRLHIWTHGSAAVWSNPLFGIGLNDWERPSWMGASVDNFWLNTAMRYGIPGFLLLAAGIAANLVRIMRQPLPEALREVRAGHVIAAAGTIMALCTVHVWGAPAILIMFYFGAGAWLFTAPVAGDGDAAPSAAPDARTGTPRRGAAEPGPAAVPAPAGAPEPAARRGGPTKAERLARRQAQYSRRRP